VGLLWWQQVRTAGRQLAGGTQPPRAGGGRPYVQSDQRRREPYLRPDEHAGGLLLGRQCRRPTGRLHDDTTDVPGESGGWRDAGRRFGGQQVRLWGIARSETVLLGQK